VAGTPVKRLWLDNGAGVRAKVLGGAAEAEISAQIENGGLRIQVENVRQTVLGAWPLPKSAWIGQVRPLFQKIAQNAPQAVQVLLNTDGTGCWVDVPGLRLTRLTIAAPLVILGVSAE
jgi:hypothetical protein